MEKIMNPCEQFQRQLLEDLYGLLDGAEAQGLHDHVSACAACRTARDRAQVHRSMLAAAAKEEFPGVRFVPPPQGTRLKPAPSPAVKYRPTFARWAIAAAVLLIASVAGIAGFTWLGYSNAVAEAQQAYDKAVADRTLFEQRRAEEHENLLREQRDLHAQIGNVEKKWTQEAAAAEREARSREIQLIVSGPRTLQAGAPNRFHIQTVDRNNAPKSAVVRLAVLDVKSKQELLHRDLQTGAAGTVLDLPRDLPVTPGSQLTLRVTAEGEGGKASVSEQLPLIAPVFLTHLTTDRPMYRPGEVVHFRSLTLERFSLKPAAEDLRLHYAITNPLGAVVFQLEGPPRLMRDGAAVSGPDGKPLRGVGAGEFRIPVNAPGGEYTLTLSDAEQRFAVEQRKFLVNRYQAPRLNKELEFIRKSYGAGEEVEAQCKVARVEGGSPLVNQPVVATVQVDGQPCPVLGSLRTDAQGNVPPIRFKLPLQIERGEGTLSVQFTDGANHETLVRPIPILLRKLHVEFFPESGDLVAGVPNRVYFQARTTLNKPAELTSRLVDGQGNTVTAVQTLRDDKQPGVNQGMGVFEFVPRTGQSYELKIDAPLGIEGRYPLPMAGTDGVVLNVPAGVATDKIDAVLHSVGRDRSLLVGVYCRGRLLDHTRLMVKPGEAAHVTLKPAADVSGVYRVTVFEEQGNNLSVLAPAAERLIYRRSAERLHLALTPDKAKYSPGDRVKLSVRALDNQEQAIPAVLLVKVVDQSILKLADEKTARTMPTQFYLGTEVRKAEDLEYADFLLTDHPKAAAALDLLLGTQGWRRFAEQDPDKFRQAQPQDAERLLVASGQSAPPAGDPLAVALKRVDERFAPEYVDLQARLGANEAAVGRQKSAPPQLGHFAETIASTRADLHAAELRLQDFTDWLRNPAVRAVLALSLLAGLLAIGVALLRTHDRRVRAYLMTGGVVLAFIGIGTIVGVFCSEIAERTAAKYSSDFERGDVAFAPLAQLQINSPQEQPAGPRMGNGALKLAEERRAGVENADNFSGFADRDGKALRLGLERFGRDKAAVKEDLNAARMDPATPDGLHELARVADQGQLGQMKRARAFGGRGVQLRALHDDARLMRREEELRREGQFGLIVQRRLQRVVAGPQSLPPLMVREYAHRHENSADKVRRDFTETVYWHPALVLVNGQGEASFDLPDSTTTFEVQASAHTLDGRLAAARAEVVSRLPFSLEPKIPMEVTSSDKVIIPVAVANDTSQRRSIDIHAECEGLKILGSTGGQVMVDADRRSRQLLEFQPKLVEGTARVRLTGRCDAFGTDTVERSFKVVPEGFPIENAHSDLLEGTAQTTITLPETWVKGTLKCQAQVFPSILADLQKGLEGLLREPGGCFEQTSTSNYPNVLILNYLKENSQTRPEIEERARRLLDSGYRQLIQFECLSSDRQTPRKGYEWFGGSAPPHEALTAYGLLEFRDMARVYSVDSGMVERTRQYLLSQRDGKGGFRRNPQALDTFGRAPENITNAYIVWAITESGADDKLETELAALYEQALVSKDPYFLALVGNSLLNRGKAEEAMKLLKSLVAAQKTDGHLEAAQTSITGSGGRDLEIETTALTTLAWLKANRPAEFHSTIGKANRWIGQQRGGYGGFGSTQSTILALKALIAFTRENRKTAEAGDLKLFVNDVAEPVAMMHFTAGTLEPIIARLPREDLLKPGNNKVRVEMTGKNSFPYTLSWSYQTLKPANDENCPVQLNAKLDRSSATEGETVRLTAVLENKTGKGQGMAVAILGLPGGLALPDDLRQLKDLARLRDNDTRPGVISAFEIRGRELVLYWRDLAPDQKIEVNLDLICRIPGEYRGPACRAYLYYNADHKFWIEPLRMTITPRPGA
jgi:hypothetical protein